MKIGSLNICGIKDDITKRANILNFIKNNRMNIVCFQETHLNSKDEVIDCFKSLKGTLYHSVHLEGRKHGICTWFSPDIDIEFIHHLADTEGRIISVKFKLADQIFNLINVYSPNIPADRVSFLHSLNKYVIPEDPDHPPCEYIFAGDWNCIEDYSMDKLSGGSWRGVLSGRDQIRHLKTQFDLRDTFRSFNPDLQKFTHFSKQYNTKTRIDRIYSSSVFRSLITKADIKPCTYSDHSMAYCVFHLDDAPRGHAH